VVRQRSIGEGDLIDVSLLDSDLALMAPRIAAYLAGEPEPAPSGGTDSVLAVYQRFSTGDRDIVIAIGNDVIWQRFCAAVGHPGMASDERLYDNVGRRNRTAAEWLAVLRGAGVPASLVQGLSETTTDPQVVARGSILPVPGSGGGLNGVRSPFRLLSAGTPRNERFPELGEHTVDILRESGFDDAQIDRLLDAGGVAARATPTRLAAS